MRITRHRHLGRFDSLAEVGIASKRTVRFLKLVPGGRFSAKYELYREHPEDDYLVYIRDPKDFSPKAIEGNWLADLELSFEHFQADFASLPADELGAEDAAVEAIAGFKQYFNAVDRREQFKRLMPHAHTKSDVALGIIAALLGATDLSAESIVRAYLVSLQTRSTTLLL